MLQSSVRPALTIEQEAVVLRQVGEATARAAGRDFFEALVSSLTANLGLPCALVAEVTDDPMRSRTLALCREGRLLDSVEYTLADTPCGRVIEGNSFLLSCSVRTEFPEDRRLAELGAESYLGVPLSSAGGAIIGHLAIFDTLPLGKDQRLLGLLEILAARAGAELERMRGEQALRLSQEGFRDLYDQAPIAYVYEDTESRFVSANRAAVRLLGLDPDNVAGTVGLTLVAPTADTQRRIRDAIVAIQQGKEQACIELELRRKDDGRPIWVQWWSKPDPDGKYTRTMLVDITDRVLAEQERNRLRQQNLYLREEIKSEYNFEEIVGESPALHTTLEAVKQVAPTDSSVLILGETGTGKELIARAIHNSSKRRDRPLIKVNCAALTAGLIESELFGHEKGAFTGALDKRHGRFALADGGTIFLDEIGDISPEVQVRLLRVLQEQEFEPVGSSTTIKINVRIIAATNRDLAKAVEEGTFRADLFYRLNVFPLRVPPLRERREDVPLLTHYFVDKYAVKVGNRIDGVADETMEQLVQYAWPGNVRELENVIERAVILSPTPTLELKQQALGAPAGAGPPRAAAGGARSSGTSGSAALADVERQHIVETLVRCDWRIEGPHGAAEALGLQPSTLRSRMKKLGIARRVTA